jgi:hypothetical protein
MDAEELRSDQKSDETVAPANPFIEVPYSGSDDSLVIRSD